METLEGTAQSVVFAAPEGGFTVFRLRPAGRRGIVTVTANAPAPLVGQEIALSGEWVQHCRDLAGSLKAGDLFYEIAAAPHNGLLAMPEI